MPGNLCGTLAWEPDGYNNREVYEYKVSRFWTTNLLDTHSHSLYRNGSIQLYFQGWNSPDGVVHIAADAQRGEPEVLAFSKTVYCKMFRLSEPDTEECTLVSHKSMCHICWKGHIMTPVLVQVHTSPPQAKQSAGKESPVQSQSQRERPGKVVLQFPLVSPVCIQNSEKEAVCSPAEVGAEPRCAIASTAWRLASCSPIQQPTIFFDL